MVGQFRSDTLRCRNQCLFCNMFRVLGRNRRKCQKTKVLDSGADLIHSGHNVTDRLLLPDWELESEHNNFADCADNSDFFLVHVLCRRHASVLAEIKQ